MCKIKTLDGTPLRNNEAGRTAFVVEAAKEIANSNITGYYSYKTESFDVITNDDCALSFVRINGGQQFNFAKVSSGTTEKAPAEPAPAPAPAPAEPKHQPSKSNEQILIDTLKAITANNNCNNVDENRVKEIIADVLKNSDFAPSYSVSVNSAPAVKIEGTKHKDFDDVLFWAVNGEPVYLHGPAGTGKTYLAKTVAEALNLGFYYAQSLQQKYELEGFVDAGGKYQETTFFQAFTKGGVFLFDEIDATAADVLVAFNGALANGIYNFPGVGRCEAHKDFICIAAGNTTGRGADESYTGRFQLDASTLDRFAFVAVDYDKNIEIMKANGNKELINFVYDVREQIKKQNLSYTFSPRGVQRITKAEAANMDIKKAMEQGVCGSWDHNDIKMIAANLKDKNNKYAKIFATIK